MAYTVFTYENVKNNKEIKDQWINYILHKFNAKSHWPLLTQILGDSNTLQINKLTPESFNTINKIFGVPAISEQQTSDNNNAVGISNDAYGEKLFHDAMDGNIVTPDSIRAAEYVRQLRAANAAKAQAEAGKKAKAEAVAKAKANVYAEAAAGKNNKSGKKPGMSDDEIDAFLKEELGGNTYASPGVPKGGTKTIGYEYDPNPGNISLAYAMRNAPEQERRTALIDKWNQENRSGSTYASPGIGNGGTYATGEGIKDANGNVLTNPGGDWEYQYALKNPQYGLGMMGKMSDAQRNCLQAVSDDMGYNYNFKGATRFV